MRVSLVTSVPLAEQRVVMAALPNGLARAAEAERLLNWAQIDAFPDAGYLLYNGVGSAELSWLRHEVSRRQNATRAAADSAVLVPLFGDGIGPAEQRVVRSQGVSGIYFIQCGPFVKIGKARNVSKRYIDIRQGIPFQTDLLGFIEAPVDALGESELHYHQRFAGFRQVGEWFRLTGELEVFCLALIRGVVNE